MTTLLQRIREDSLAARKATALARDEALKASEGHRATFLITLFAEAASKGKNDGNRESNDAEVLETLRTWVKNANITLTALGDTAPDSRARLAVELDMLMAYLPKQVSADDLKAAVDEAVAELPEKSIKQLGAVMGKLTARFGADFDKKLASELAKAGLK